MKTKMIKFLAVFLLFAVTVPSAPQSRQVRRYLLSAGVNNGGKDKVILRYAVSDAKAFASVLMDMGGVEKSNALILSNPTRRQLLNSIDSLNRLILAGAGAGDRSEVFVYYSGHADDAGLKIAGETLAWADFRNAVNNLSADVKVAVLDACGSGAITRTKGGVARPAFLSDASMSMKGYAFLTSSNENEASQESDRIRGSYFTYALLSGMRGAADLTGDGTVTVNEAYQYAFNETLQNTQNTRAGTQHPSRDMNLAGTGDIVLTDLRQTSATLSLDKDIEGRFFIRDGSGNLFAELRKLRGRPIELGLPPGKYIVQMEAPSKMWSAGSVVVPEGGKAVLTMNDMTSMGARRRTVSRGDVGEIEAGDAADSLSSDSLTRAEYFCDDDDLPEDIAIACQEMEADDMTDEMLDEMLGEMFDLLLPDTAAETDAREVATALPPPPVKDIDMLDSACRAPHRFNINVAAVSRKPERGVQLSLLNIANAEYCGRQISIINAANAGLDGKQTGLFNAAAKNSRGSQTGIVNMTDSTFDGTQIGLINLANGSVGGSQIGLVNLTNNNVGYAQVGLLNLTNGTVGYTQIGIVNIAGKTNVPIGIINIAKYSDGTPVGLLNLIGNGIMDVTAYLDISHERTASLRTGMPWFYTLIEYSRRTSYHYNEKSQLDLLGIGFGTRFGMNGSVMANLDIVGSNIINPYRDYNPEVSHREGDEWFQTFYKLRVGVSYSPLPYLAITGGVSMFGKMECNYDKVWNEPKTFGSMYSNEDDRGHRFHAWPGLYFGVTVGKVHSSKRSSL